MKRSPRDLLRASRPGQSIATGPIGVILAVRPDPGMKAVQARLRRLGLTVERTIGDKILGAIDSPLIAELRADPAVRQVETSVRLRPHAAD